MKTFKTYPHLFVGKKSKNLAILEGILKHNKDLCNIIVPKFEVLSAHNDKFLEEHKEEIGKFVFDKNLVSVRSSGSISTPGRMLTILNSNCENVINDIKKVRNSFNSDRLNSYLLLGKNLKEVAEFKTEVIIQEMVKPEGDFISGVIDTTESLNPEINAVFNLYGDVIMSGKIENSKLLKSGDLKENFEEAYVDIYSASIFITKFFGGKPQEIEFLYDLESTKLYILQVRNAHNEFKPIKGFVNPNLDLSLFTVIGKGTNVLKQAVHGEVSYNENNCANKIFMSYSFLDYDNIEEISKSKGIVSFNGGILSHAARISREYNVPTLVGISLKERIDLLKTVIEEVYFDKEGFLYAKMRNRHDSE